MQIAAGELGLLCTKALLFVAGVSPRSQSGRSSASTTRAARGAEPAFAPALELEPIPLVPVPLVVAPVPPAEARPKASLRELRLAPEAARALLDIGMPRDIAVAIFHAPAEAPHLRAPDVPKDAGKRFVAWLRALDWDEEARCPDMKGPKWCGEYSATQVLGLYADFCAYDRRAEVAPNLFLAALKTTPGVRFAQLVKNDKRRTYTFASARPPRPEKAVKAKTNTQRASVREPEPVKLEQPEFDGASPPARAVMHSAPEVAMQAKIERRASSGKGRTRASARSLARAA
jgi:hypothetical protein